MIRQGVTTRLLLPNRWWTNTLTMHGHAHAHAHAGTMGVQEDWAMGVVNVVWVLKG